MARTYAENSPVFSEPTATKWRKQRCGSIDGMVAVVVVGKEKVAEENFDPCVVYLCRSRYFYPVTLRRARITNAIFTIVYMFLN